MANIQIVPGSEVQTTIGGAKMDAGPFRKAELMRGHVAQAIGDNVSNLFGEFARKFQENKDARTILDADLAMRKTTDDFRASLKDNPDEKTWIPNYQEQVNQVKDRILNGPDVNPAVKRHLSGMLDTWDLRTTSEIRTAAQLQSATRTKHSAIADYTYAARQGDEAGALAALDLAERNHAMFPEDVARMRKELPGIVQQAQVETGIGTDPGTTLEKLKATGKDGKFVNFTGIPAITRESLIRQANAARNTQYANNNRLIQDRINNGDIPSEEELKNADITPSAAKSFKRQIEQKGIAASRDEAAILAMQVHDHDFSSDKNPEQSARELHDEIASLPPQLQKPIMAQLDNKLASVKKKQAAEEKPVHKQAYDQLKKDFEDGYFLPGEKTTRPVPGTGFLGLFQKKEDAGVSEASPADRKNWRDEASKENRDAATLKYAKALQKMKGFFDQNPDATYEQAEEYRQTLMQPYLLDAVKKTLSTQPSPNSPAIVKPAGAAFYSKSTGKWYDKDKKEIQ